MTHVPNSSLTQLTPCRSARPRYSYADPPPQHTHTRVGQHAKRVYAARREWPNIIPISYVSSESSTPFLPRVNSSGKTTNR